MNSPRSARSRHRKAIVSGNILLQLLRQGSGLFWGGLLVFLLAITTIAGFSITNIGYVEQPGPTSPPISIQKPDSAQTSNYKALGLLGTLLFVAGFVAIGKHLNRLSRSRRLRPRTRRSAAIELTQRREQRQQLQPESMPSKEEIPQAEELSVPSSSTASDLNASGSESLAEMMDIRKRWSLESILQKTSRETT
ncbi:MAG: hypothetical protein JO235_24020 [Chroococcidiopsidaceae cyanobacterium CP_BM_RX_35]|nr:hypothetical protein [Chroococcidiopsidaceae cyanobacterium CP_BM_RX_35]